MLFRKCFLIMFAVILISPNSRANDMKHFWSKRFGDEANQYGRGVAVDDSGNIIITGGFDGNVIFGCDTLLSDDYRDVFVAKLDPDSGNCIWSLCTGAGYLEEGEAVVVDGSGNFIIMGYAYHGVDFGCGPMAGAGGSDIFVAKLEPDSGNCIWSKRFGDTFDQYAMSVVVDGGDSVIVTGLFKGTVDFGCGPLTSAGDWDIFVAKFEPDSGNCIWSQSFGDSLFQHATGVAIDGGDNLIVSGGFEGAVVFGCDTLTNSGERDIFVLKLSPDGNCIWNQSFGDSFFQDATSVAVDGGDNVFVTGSFLGTVDFGCGPLTSAGGHDVFVAKFEPNSGNCIWSRRFGDASNQYGHSIVVDPSGNVVFTGEYYFGLDFGCGTLTNAGSKPNVFVAKLEPDSGNCIWSQGFGDSESQIGHGITVDASGNVIVTGEFLGAVDFGGEVLTSAGLVDIFVAKFRPAMKPLVRPRGEWRYTFDEPDSCWTCLEFNDSSWSIGNSPFGNTPNRTFGCPLPSCCTDWPNDAYHDSLWVRKVFSVSDHQVHDWRLYYGVDNGAKIYLNGVLVADTLIVEPYEFNYDWFSPVHLDASLFQVGENVIAALLRNTIDFTAFDLKIGMDCVTSVGEAYTRDMPLSIRLYQNYPNPFNPTTTIQYDLREHAVVDLRIYDVRGRLVRVVIFPTWKEAGQHIEYWDGRNDKGEQVSSGVYFYRLKAAGHVLTRKMVLIH